MWCAIAAVQLPHLYGTLRSPEESSAACYVLYSRRETIQAGPAASLAAAAAGGGDATDDPTARSVGGRGSPFPPSTMQPEQHNRPLVSSPGPMLPASSSVGTATSATRIPPKLSYGKIDLSSENFIALREGQMLNDDVVNIVLNIFRTAIATESTTRCHVFLTYFMTKLAEPDSAEWVGSAQCQRWLRKEKVPVCVCVCVCVCARACFVALLCNLSLAVHHRFRLTWLTSSCCLRSALGTGRWWLWICGGGRSRITTPYPAQRSLRGFKEYA